MAQDFITQFADQVKIKLISQLIKGISRVQQNYLDILIVPLFQHFLYHYYLLSCFFSLSLNKSVVELLVSNLVVPHLFAADSSIKYCHNFPDVFQ